MYRPLRPKLFIGFFELPMVSIPGGMYRPLRRPDARLRDSNGRRFNPRRDVSASQTML